MTMKKYFNTVMSIEVWRTSLIFTPFPTILIGGTSQLTKLFTLPVGLFTSLYSSRYIPTIALFSSPMLETSFLLLSLLSLMLAYSITCSNHQQYEREHDLLVQDILQHEEFLRLKEYFHHSNHIYDHVKRVSYLSYRISKALGFDYTASARGGLLHDFFLYDWRVRKATDPKRSLHGKEHPFIALENARRYFSVSAKEEDIIVKHMFPKTLALPRYKESVVVSISDKLAAIYEYLTSFKKG